MKLEVTVTIDKISLSTHDRFEVDYQYKMLPDYRYLRSFDPRDFEENDTYLHNYLKVAKFEHKRTGNILLISNKRRKEAKRAKPLYLIFLSSHEKPLSYSEAYTVERFFRDNHNVHLQVSQVHLAVDLITPKKIGLYQKVIRAVKPGWKRRPVDEPSYESTTYFGSLESSNSLAIYDKAKQLRKVKMVKVRGDICRVETRMYVPYLRNFVRTLDDLAIRKWSFVYPKFFSFHQPTAALKKKLRAIGENWRRPIWELRDLVEEELGIWPSNFYTRYLEEHPHFSKPTRQALDNYRWCQDYRRYKRC